LEVRRNLATDEYLDGGSIRWEKGGREREGEAVGLGEDGWVEDGIGGARVRVGPRCELSEAERGPRTAVVRVGVKLEDGIA
jgi:hypothetical protein